MANHIQFRRVEVREGNPVDGYRTKETRLQYRTKDIVSSVLGLIPLASSWSDWADIRTDVVLLDENGNPSS